MSKSKTELWIDALAPIVTVIGLIVTVILFNKEQREINHRDLTSKIQQELLHSKRNQWEKQQEIYARLADVVGSLASELYNKKTYESNTFDDFYDLFFGSIVLVEDDEVREAMNLLHLDIKKLRENKRSVFQKEDPVVMVIRSSNFLIESLKTSSNKYREEIKEYQKTLSNETSD
ncbi:hypothetical protein [Ekhidna sp.]|jgi:hypothetical protein|uniref:hypothetical protein n=1 Tax=Ekhidna sp. TaxID=2608089 RepID=UPI0032EB614F